MKNLSQFYNLARPIIITGASGTGKSHLAKHIYEKSQIHKEKFRHVHLTSLQEDLFASELFGHKKGSFTGAIQSSMGYVEEVGGGTLFLDEIGDISLKAQKSLLFLIEEGVYYIVGTTIPKRLRARLILATRRDLKSLVEKKQFREDLYYRLMLFNIELGPLCASRERLKNKILLFFDRMRRSFEKPDLALDDKVFEFLLGYSWPGNVRELKNCLEYCCFVAEKSVSMEDLPDWIKSSKAPLRNFSNYHNSLELFEKDYLTKALYKFQGGINTTCSGIGISKSTLIAKIKKYDINVWEIKAKLKAQNHGI